MQLATIDFDRKKISSAASRYSRSPEVKPILDAIKNKWRIIDLQKSFALFGLNDDGLPKLAVSPEPECYFQVSGNGFRMGSFNREMRFPSVTLKFPWYKSIGIPERYVTKCPLVPDDVQAKMKQDDLLAWEVDEWVPYGSALADDNRIVRQSLDPVVLRHVTGNLYAVIAEWDLTDLEKEVFGHLNV